MAKPEPRPCQRLGDAEALSHIEEAEVTKEKAPGASAPPLGHDGAAVAGAGDLEDDLEFVIGAFFGEGAEEAPDVLFQSPLVIFFSS